MYFIEFMLFLPEINVGLYIYIYIQGGPAYFPQYVDAIQCVTGISV